MFPVYIFIFSHFYTWIFTWSICIENFKFESYKWKKLSWLFFVILLLIQPQTVIYESNNSAAEKACYFSNEINENVKSEEVLSDEKLIREKSMPPVY